MALGIFVYKKGKAKQEKKRQARNESPINEDKEILVPDNESIDGEYTDIKIESDDYVFLPTAIFNVAGVTAKNDEGKDIQKLISSYVKDWLGYNDAYEGLTNKEIKEDYYGDKVYEADVFSFDDITFIPEPDNPYDANAIKVIHEELGHIGYVPKSDTKEVKEILKHHEYRVEGEILGGKYKYVDEFEDKVKVNKHNYGIKLIVSAE